MSSNCTNYALALLRQPSRAQSPQSAPHLKGATNSVDRQNQTHAATHNICGLRVPRRRYPVVPLSLSLKRESELQAFSCVLTEVMAPCSYEVRAL